MAVPLIILAVLSAIGGFVGFPIIEGADKFKEFLAPSIAVLHPEAHHPMSFEIFMMAFSMAVAGVGIFIAYKCYIKKPELPDRVVAKFPVVYEYIYNKYYMDEFYDAAVVEPIKDGSNFLWHGVDETVVDGAVNGSARTRRLAQRPSPQAGNRLRTNLCPGHPHGGGSHRGLSHRTLT